MTDNKVTINTLDVDTSKGPQWREPTTQEKIAYDLNGLPRIETDAEAKVQADELGKEYFNLLMRANAPVDPKAVYYAKLMAGKIDLGGKPLNGDSYEEKIYADLLQKANQPVDPNMDDNDARAEAVYFTKSMTGMDDVPGKLWRKGGFATGKEYLAYMRNF